jgi:outer membrane protein TolC
MKLHGLFLASSVFAVSLYASSPSVNDLILPERVFPQLDGILRGAVQQSPRMLSRALDLEIAENNRIQARSNLLPSLSGSYSYYQASDDRADLSGRHGVTKVAYSAVLVQPIFFWGERRNNDRMGAIQLKVSQGQYRDAYRLLAQELRGSYMRLIVQKIAVARSRFNVEYAQTQLKLQEDRLAKKVISESDIFNVRLTAEQAQITLERAEFDLLNAKASFARLAGLSGMTDEEIPDSIPVVAYSPAPFDQLLAGFLAQKDPPTTEAFALRHQLEIGNLTYANQKTRLRPKVSAVLGTYQDEQAYSLNVAQKYQVNSIYGGVSVSWAIFDGFASGAATRNALASRRQMENDYRQLTARLAQDAQSQVKQINFSARNVSIYDRFLTSGQENVKATQGEFKRGVKSESDVSLAQLGLYDAQISAGNARIDYLLKIGDFLGTVMEDPVVANLAAK